MPPKPAFTASTAGTKKIRSKLRIEGGDDHTVVTYNALGDVLFTDVDARKLYRRHFIPGYSSGLGFFRGTDIVGAYSTGVFKQGSSIRWEPIASFSTPGRVVVGFSDNPEVMVAWETALSDNVRQGIVQGLGNAVSFPVWQETTIPFPAHKLRRKRFSVNRNVETDDIADMERSCQITMFVYITSPTAEEPLGLFHFHDVVDCEGIVPSQLT